MQASKLTLSLSLKRKTRIIDWIEREKKKGKERVKWNGRRANGDELEDKLIINYPAIWAARSMEGAAKSKPFAPFHFTPFHKSFSFLLNYEKEKYYNSNLYEADSYLVIINESNSIEWNEIGLIECWLRRELVAEWSGNGVGWGWAVLGWVIGGCKPQATSPKKRRAQPTECLFSFSFPFVIEWIWMNKLRKEIKRWNWKEVCEWLSWRKREGNWAMKLMKLIEWSNAATSLFRKRRTPPQAGQPSAASLFHQLSFLCGWAWKASKEKDELLGCFLFSFN